MVGSANINQKWLMCQVSPENRRKRRAWTKMSKVPLMAVHSRKYSKILVLPENCRECQFWQKIFQNANFNREMVENAVFDGKWS